MWSAENGKERSHMLSSYEIKSSKEGVCFMDATDLFKNTYLNFTTAISIPVGSASNIVQMFFYTVIFYVEIKNTPFFMLKCEYK
jgi:hypothetical protein